MNAALDLTLLVVGIALAALSRRWGWSAPLVLVVAGLIASFLPGVGDVGLSPEFVLYGALPPLLFHTALESSSVGLRANTRPIALLSVGLVLFTTAAVAVAVYFVVPGLGWPMSIVLGAIVSPPDAVAATAIGRTLGLPRRILTILSGESLLNDATALTVYRVAVAAAVGGSVSVWSGIGVFGLAVVVGIAVGFVVGYLARRVLCWLTDSVVEVSVFLIVPFAAYPIAELAHGSGVLAVVTAGLTLGRAFPRMNYATRLEGTAVFGVIDFLLETTVFGLIGLQLRTVIAGLSGIPASEVVTAAITVTLVMFLARIVWMFPATYLPRKLSASLRARDPSPPIAYPVVMSWAGMRGVVTLAAAFALPLTTSSGAPLPGRDLVLFCSFVAVIASLLIQGLTLPALVRSLRLVGKDSEMDTLAEAQAAYRAEQAAVARLDELTDDSGSPTEVVERLREQAMRRSNAAWERLGPRGEGRRETPSEAYRRLRREMLQAERGIYLAERDAGHIDDEVLRAVQRELDLEEASMAR
jgi:CPA1 family monovalent cation:H+ antiporter